jgi:hypothetical protein
MTWADKLEQKRGLLLGGITAICAAALAVTSRRLPVSFDAYWHLQTGLDWIHKGLSPWIDHYSFTYQGEAISAQPVFFQALLAWLVDLLGLESGFQAIKFGSFIMALTLMFLFLRRLRSPASLYILVLPLLTLLLELRSTIRPELFDYSLSILAVMLYHRAQGRLTAGNTSLIALLMLLWANYHNSTLGYILFFGLFLDVAISQARDRADVFAWLRWLGWGLLILGVGFLNKGLTHPMIYAFGFSPKWWVYLDEYQSAALYRGIPGVYALAAVAAVTAFLAIRQRRFGYLVVTLIFAFYSFRLARLVTPCGIIVLCLFASLASNAPIRNGLEFRNSVEQKFSGAVYALLVLVTLFSSVTLARAFMQENRTSILMRPELVVNYMKEQGLSGRIFNEYGIGGYLIYALGPESTVYVDGRTHILYPPEHYERYLKARNDPLVFTGETNKYGIDFALLQSGTSAYRVMEEAGVLGLDFVDFKYSLFSRKNPRFPTSGRLLGNPACWNEADRQALLDEQLVADLQLPRNSSLLPNLHFMVNFAEAEDRSQFLSESEDASKLNELQSRFAAYQSLLSGRDETALRFLRQVRQRGLREYLAAAVAQARLGDWRAAEATVDELTRIPWPFVTPADITMMYRVTESIRRNSGLHLLPGSYADGLKEQVRLMGRSDSALELDLGLLCPVD